MKRLQTVLFHLRHHFVLAFAEPASFFLMRRTKPGPTQQKTPMPRISQQ